MQNLGGIFKGLPCTREAFSSFPIRTPELRPLGSLLVGEVWRSAFPRPPLPPRLHLASHHLTHLSEIEFLFTAPKSSVSCPCILTSGHPLLPDVEISSWFGPSRPPGFFDTAPLLLRNTQTTQTGDVPCTLWLASPAGSLPKKASVSLEPTGQNPTHLSRASRYLHFEDFPKTSWLKVISLLPVTPELSWLC